MDLDRAVELGRVVEYARRILAELRRVDEELDRLATASGGTAAIGALPVAAAGVLPGVLTRLKRQHPAIGVRLSQGRTEDLLPMLAAAEIDLIVGRLYQPAVPDGFRRETLWAEPVSILARSDHPIFATPCPGIDDLRRYELVLPTVTQRVGQEIDHMLDLLGLSATAAFRSSSYGFIREMLYGSDALSMMPRLMMVGDLLRGTLRVVPLPIAAPVRPAGLILPRDRPLSPATRVLADCLREYVAEIQSRGLFDITDGNTDAPISDTPDRTGDA
jgi:LysR family pca operon transcriptional activator